MKKNILIISAVFPPEPVVSAKLSEDLAIALSESQEVTVIAPRPTRPYGFNFNERLKKRPFTLINLNSFTCPESNSFGRLRESYSFGIACKKYIEKNHKKIDVIYMNSWPIFAQYFTAKTAHKHNIPLITHVQDVYPESLSAKMPVVGCLFKILLKPIDTFTLKKSKKVIAISEKMRGYLSSTRNVSLKKIHVVKNWQNEEAFIEYDTIKKNTNKKEKLFTFMYMGNIGPVAGIDLLIESFYNANLEKCKLVIAGSGSKKEELENMVSSRNIERVEFVAVADGKVPEIQGEADVMLLPIKKGAASSSIPSKLPAYMFSKKPIIASVDLDSDSARIINEANAGWVLVPEDTDLLTKAMEVASLVEKKELNLKGENGFKYAISHLSKKNNLQQIVNVILDLI
jgi:glycosyltransferase involved in cell wall biosynthesis